MGADSKCPMPGCTGHLIVTVEYIPEYDKTWTRGVCDQCFRGWNFSLLKRIANGQPALMCPRCKDWKNSQGNFHCRRYDDGTPDKYDCGGCHMVGWSIGDILRASAKVHEPTKTKVAYEMFKAAYRPEPIDVERLRNRSTAAREVFGDG